MEEGGREGGREKGRKKEEGEEREGEREITGTELIEILQARKLWNNICRSLREKDGSSDKIPG